MSDKTVGVIGAGSFGTAVANLLAENGKVLIYARRQEVIDKILSTRENLNQKVNKNVEPTGDLQRIASECTLIFPTVPSAFFSDVLKQINPYLRPDHILIHGTKGFNVKLKDGETFDDLKTISRNRFQTMSELILKETVVVRVGCISGPNLARELALHLPAGTVIASHFEEVIQEGRRALKSPRLQAFGSHDLFGVELAGALKNVIAIGSGAVTGMELGENTRALLISKSLGELVRIGKALGADIKSFLGLAGIGDIIATATSSLSRNYTVGYRLARGETLQHVIDTSEEVAEGIHTVKVAKKLADHYKVRAPIIQIIHKMLFEELPAPEALEYLMKYQFEQDVDFL